MPKNKNAMVRYKILDELLRDQYHEYSINDLTQEVNDYLSDLNSQSEGVGLRTIQKDLNDLKSIFLVDIKEWWVSYYNKELRKTTQKKCFRYTDPSFSIFKKELSDDEKFLIREALSLLGKFDGLPDFDGLNSLKSSLGIDKSYNAIVSFDKNPKEDKTCFGELFTAISQKMVIEIEYHKYAIDLTSFKYTLHPYLLKEYNRRWHLYAADINDDCKIKNFPLDRIDSVTFQPSIDFVEYDGNLSERFEEIVGVSYYENNPIEEILFWVSDESHNYVIDKPIHIEQTTIRNPEIIAKYREQYPHLIGGTFFTLKCRNNYELIRELSSFGKELLVLEPINIQDKIINRIQEMNDSYSKLRK
ncbi:MAG: WYL domain-containing protein [Muribaculaceae bacterium]|nr:WYL domain-containing protein [Muribaculaceae bacterium]